MNIPLKKRFIAEEISCPIEVLSDPFSNGLLPAFRESAARLSSLVREMRRSNSVFNSPYLLFLVIAFKIR